MALLFSPQNTTNNHNKNKHKCFSRECFMIDKMNKMFDGIKFKCLIVFICFNQYGDNSYLQLVQSIEKSGTKLSPNHHYSLPLSNVIAPHLQW